VCECIGSDIISPNGSCDHIIGLHVFHTHIHTHTHFEQFVGDMMKKHGA